MRKIKTAADHGRHSVIRWERNGGSMRAVTRLVLASLTAAVLVVTGPAVFASAAPAPHAGSSAVSIGTDGRTVAIPMTPGKHTVSETIAMTSHPHATPAASKPEIKVRVGKNNCGGFNGDWTIAIIGYETSPTGDSLPLYGLQVWGEEWDSCDVYTPNTTVYTYVKFTALGITDNEPLDTSAHGNSVGVEVNTFPTGVVSAGDIYVTACLKWNNGWGCGPSQHLKD
jgi:hypothetical protein